MSYGSCRDIFGIDVTGLCDINAFDLTTNPYWTEISVPETLIVPDYKPSIEQINAINIAADILESKVIVTPQLYSTESPYDPIPNFEGRNATGRKLIIEGRLCQTISYTADLPEQSVHSVHFAVPFSAYIVLPLTITIDTTPVDTLNLNFQVNTCIEDVYIKEFCDRYIFKNVTLLMQAVPTPLMRTVCENEL